MAKDTNMELERLQEALLEAELQAEGPTRRFEITDAEPPGPEPEKSRGLTWALVFCVSTAVFALGAAVWYLLRHGGYLG